MQCLDQNKQTIWYALYTGETELTDAYGNKTGQYEISYSTPVKVRMNVSASRGTSDLEQFGINDNYTKTIATDDMTTPFDTATVWWIGNGEPSATNSYNYITVRVARSLNSTRIAIREVNTLG